MAYSGQRAHYEDEADDPPLKRLTRTQAQALRARLPKVSPWRVVGAQAVLGVVVAASAWLFTGSVSVAMSALYGAFVVVLPAALMARGATSPLTSLSPLTSAVGMLVWTGVKMGLSVLLLALAVRVVQPLDWPALLVGLVVCLQVYWVALLWRGRSKN